MFVVTVTFDVQPEHADAFRQRVLQQASDTLENESTCQTFQVSVSPERPEAFFLYEVYDDEAAFQVHCNQPYFADFGKTVEPWIQSKSITTYHRISPS